MKHRGISNRITPEQIYCTAITDENFQIERVERFKYLN